MPARSMTKVTGSLCNATSHRDLVERALQERRVDATTGRRPRIASPGGERHGMLLGDADIEEAVRKALRELEEPGRMMPSRR